MFDSQRVSTRIFVDNNPLVIDGGIESIIDQCSRQKASRIGLGNTPAFLVDRHPMCPDRESVEERTIGLMRQARLRSFNDYREAFGLGRLTSFAGLTGDVEVQQKLARLYGDVDAVEWYVGIFAEDYPRHRMMGELLTTMVAHDAFTQAFTNPLLARHVYHEDTFSEVGMGIIEQTHCLQQIVERNSSTCDKAYASFRIE